MSKPKIIEIGEILELHRGYDLPISQRIEGNIPVYGSSGITGWHDNYKCDGELIITGRCGTIGKVFYHKGKCWPLNTSLYLSDSKGNDVRYLGYLLQYSFDELIRVKGQENSAVPGIDRKVIHSLKTVFWDSLNYQKKVSNFLSNIDRLIEKNTQMIATLESMAKTLYDYWFVQFDFPDANGRPYKTSGGKMVWNEDLGREIPEGWEVLPIINIVDVRDGTHDSPKYLDSGKYLITSKNLTAAGINFDNANYISEEDFININKRSSVENDDILFSMIGALGIVYKIDEEQIDFAVKNVAIYKTSATPNLINYIYETLKSKYMSAYIIRSQAGSIQKFIGLGTLREMPILYKENIIEKYYTMTKNIYTLMSIIKKENQKLTSLRDFLLPMLMNGQVTFK